MWPITDCMSAVARSPGKIMEFMQMMMMMKMLVRQSNHCGFYGPVFLLPSDLFVSFSTHVCSFLVAGPAST